VLWAIFFFLIAWEHIGFIFLVGIGRMWQATIFYLIGAAIMLLFMHILIPDYGINGAFVSMCLGPAIATSIAYPYIFWRIMLRNAK
jgi:O-antigen/teichoic acid export membrane protein